MACLTPLFLTLSLLLASLPHQHVLPSYLHLPTLTLVIVNSISRASKRLLDRRPRFRCDIELGKLRSCLEDIDARGVEDLLGRRDSDGKVGVLGQARDEEHEAAGFDLHFGKVCAAGGYVCVFPVGVSG
jgi:hypothetical protein